MSEYLKVIGEAIAGAVKEKLDAEFQRGVERGKFERSRELAAMREYVVRLEGAIGDVLTLVKHSTGVVGLHLNGNVAEWDDLFGSWLHGLDTIIATSPLSGQPLQNLQQFGWRPIAEAPRDGTPIEAGDPDSGFVRVVQYASECGGAWYLLGSADTYYALDYFKVFRPVPVVPAPPKEGE